MTADPTSAADPRLAELTEALRQTPPDRFRRDGLYDHAAFAAAILALLPARTATTEAEQQRDAAIWSRDETLRLAAERDTLTRADCDRRR
jgi:hypothetical protein